MLNLLVSYYLFSEKFSFENYRLIGRLLTLTSNYDNELLRKVKKKYLEEKAYKFVEINTIKRNIQSEFLNSGIIILKKYNGNIITTDWTSGFISFKIKQKNNIYNFKIIDSLEVRRRFYLMIYNLIMKHDYNLGMFNQFRDSINYYEKNKIMKNTDQTYLCHLLCNNNVW